MRFSSKNRVLIISILLLVISGFSTDLLSQSSTSSWNWDVTSGVDILIVTGDSFYADPNMEQNFNYIYTSVGNNVTIVKDYDFVTNNFASSSYDALLFSAIEGVDYFTNQELNEIVKWYNTGNKLLWVAGNSDFAGYYISNATSNKILQAVKSNLRLDAGALEDPSSSDGAAYRVIANESGVSSPITSYVAGDFISCMFYAPTTVNFYNYTDNTYYDLRNMSIIDYNIDIIVNSSSAAIALDQDLSLGPADVYPYSTITGNYPMLAAQQYNGSIVITSGREIFSDYKNMYGLTFFYGQNSQDGAKVVDKLFNYWFVELGNSLGAELVERPIVKETTTMTTTAYSVITSGVTTTETTTVTEVQTETSEVTNTTTVSSILTETSTINNTITVTERNSADISRSSVGVQVGTDFYIFGLLFSLTSISLYSARKRK